MKTGKNANSGAGSPRAVSRSRSAAAAKTRGRGGVPRKLRICRFISAADESFWNALELYPKGLERLGKLSAIAQTAREILAGLGMGNLCVLIEESKVARPADSTDKTLAGLLVSEADAATIVYLREFLRRRSEAVDVVFRRVFRRKATALSASVVELSPRHAETIKPLTKLMLLYRLDPEHLREVHAQAAWLSRPIAFEYQISAQIPSNAASKIEASAAELAKSISQAIGKRNVQFVRKEKSSEGITVFTFFREFSGVVRADFRDTFNVHHGCGQVLFGLSEDRRRILVKSGNRSIATAIASFIQSTFAVELALVQDQLFADYTVENLRSRVLGDYPQGYGIEIVAASFARSGFGGHGPLSLGTPYLQPSIRPELEYVQEQGLVEIHGPRDVQWITLTHAGRTVTVTTLVEKNGAVRFAFENAGWSTEESVAFEDAFYKTFGVPVNRLLHPAKVALGSVTIYECLFGLTNEEDMEPFHEDFLALLLERRLVTQQSVETKLCRNNVCKDRNRPVDDPLRERCGRCEEDLQDWTLHRLERNPDAIAAFVASLLDDADDWTGGNQVRELDGLPYYELRRTRADGQEDSVCMIVADRPSRDVFRTFGRTGLPLLFVQARTDSRYAYVDEDCSARISLSYLLSSQETDETKRDCNDVCRVTLQRLLQTHEERTLRAARASFEQLTRAGSTIDGDVYERDVFNILRSIFPYTYDLGRKGQVEPDGYVCLPNYENNSIEEVSSWNWSYDAKYSEREKGYGFDIDEARKIITYVNKLRRNRRALFGGNNRPRAHVLISNNLSEQKLKTAASHIFGPDGISATHLDMRLILMRQDFLVALYEFVRDHHEDVSKRRPLFSDAVIRLLSSAPLLGYLILDATHVETLKARFLDATPVEHVLKKESLLRALDD